MTKNFCRIASAIHFSVLMLLPLGTRAEDPSLDEPVVLTLDKAISMALEQNRDILIADQDRHKAEAQIGEARSGAFPQFYINGSYSRYFLKQVLFLPPNSMINPTDRDTSAGDWIGQRVHRDRPDLPDSVQQETGCSNGYRGDISGVLRAGVSGRQRRCHASGQEDLSTPSCSRRSWCKQTGRDSTWSRQISKMCNPNSVTARPRNLISCGPRCSWQTPNHS